MINNIEFLQVVKSLHLKDFNEECLQIVKEQEARGLTITIDFRPVYSEGQKLLFIPQ